jgi:hypothetical protein
MRPVLDLGHLERHSRQRLYRFDRRARLIRAGLSDDARPLDVHQLETEMALLMVHLQAYWSNWCRAFYLSVSVGTLSRSGINLISAIPLPTERDAMTVAIKGKLIPNPPARWQSHQEPKWFSPADLVRVLQAANVTNCQNAIVILNSIPRGIDHLRTMRNYFAHRSEEMKARALTVGPFYLIGSAQKPSEILNFVEPGRSLSVAQRFISDMQRVCTALTS